MFVESLSGIYTLSVIHGIPYIAIVQGYALILRYLYGPTIAGWRLGVVMLFAMAGMAVGGWLGGAIFDATLTYRSAFQVALAFNLLNLMLLGALLFIAAPPYLCLSLAPGHECSMSNDLWKLTAVEAVTRLKKREISPLDLVEASARRIAEVEPAVNALPTLCLDRARDHAKRIMAGGAACEAAGEAGWLAGLPVSIKDLTDVAGVRTTYGSPIFADHVPAKSHPLVERIERKGGIVMGKSNTPEFGAGGSTFNEVFGRTRNPWNTSLTCGGSTGGGAVSVATGEVWLAHGTDHGGSLRRPGTYCSVVGLRPSPGRVTRGTVEQSLVAAVGAGPDGAQRGRPGAVPRHHGGLLPARSDDLRCAGRVVQRRRGATRRAQARRLHRRLQRPMRDRPRGPRDLHQGGAALRGAGLHRRGGLARHRRRSTRRS